MKLYFFINVQHTGDTDLGQAECTQCDVYLICFVVPRSTENLLQLLHIKESTGDLSSIRSLDNFSVMNFNNWSVSRKNDIGFDIIIFLQLMNWYFLDFAFNEYLTFIRLAHSDIV